MYELSCIYKKMCSSIECSFIRTGAGCNTQLNRKIKPLVLKKLNFL